MMHGLQAGLSQEQTCVPGPDCLDTGALRGDFWMVLAWPLWADLQAAQAAVLCHHWGDRLHADWGSVVQLSRGQSELQQVPDAFASASSGPSLQPWPQSSCPYKKTDKG